jgi:hypothetical protein
MSNLIKPFLVLITCVLGFVLIASAQEVLFTEVSPEVIEAINLDENIKPEDLGISEPNVLPDNPFYFFKEWGRNIQSFFTFNPVKKVELKEKFANEKLIELKKMVEQKKAGKRIEKAIENYQNEVEEAKRLTERIRVKAEESEEVGKFLDKFIQHQALHQRLLQKLETQVPTEALGKIREARERHIEKFGEVMTRLENKENIQERLEKNLKEVKGSEFKNFKNLEILLELEEKIPEKAKEAIQKAQENTLKRLQGDLEKMSSENQERFKEYIDKISGNKEKQLEILENLRSEIKGVPETPKVLKLKEELEEGRERILKRIRERTKEINCPTIEKSAPGFCEEGRIMAKKDDEGCIVSFDCVIPAEIEILPKPEKPQACITIWDPVCGKNGKTYSNACFAKLADVEITYKGKCKEKECQTDADCPQLRCGPAGTISVRCIGMKAKCVEGKCQIISLPLPIKLQAGKTPE